MNSLLIFPEELVEPRRAVLQGLRADYFHEWHGIKEDTEVSAVLYGERRGRARVLSATTSEVNLAVVFEEALPSRFPVDLILAVPRPQTVKKVLQVASTYGVSSIHFLRTKRVVKSYLQSKSLEHENIQRELMKGLEQAGDPLPPSVHVHDHLREFFSLHLTALQMDNSSDGQAAAGVLQLIADTRIESQRSLAQVWPADPISRVVLAIGPEAGWEQSEVERFRQQGFEPLWLSQRTLRVEAAVTAALGQLELFLQRN